MGREARLRRLRGRKRAEQAWEQRKRRARILDLITMPASLEAIRRAMLRAGTRKNSCIAATKLYVELATRMGLEALPLRVETSVINPALWEWIEANELISEEPTATLSDETLAAAVGAGGHMVVIGYRNDSARVPGHWAGHLVALVSAGGRPRVVDLTLDQAERPEKQIVGLGPRCFVVPEPWVRGEMVARAFVKTASGKIAVEYAVLENDRQYESSPDWNRTYNPMLTADENGVRFTMDPIRGGR